MNNRIFKIAYAVFIALIAVALFVFMLIHISRGVAGANEKLILGAYVLMILWALMKLYTAVRNIKQLDTRE